MYNKRFDTVNIKGIPSRLVSSLRTLCGTVYIGEAKQSVNTSVIEHEHCSKFTFLEISK